MKKCPNCARYSFDQEGCVPQWCEYCGSGTEVIPNHPLSEFVMYLDPYSGETIKQYTTGASGLPLPRLERTHWVGGSPVTINMHQVWPRK